MQPFEQGLRAYQAGQYTGALDYFQQALTEANRQDDPETDRLLMWIARCGLITANHAALLDACAQMLSSPDAEVRHFANHTLRNHGLAHPETARARPITDIWQVASAIYFKQFWVLLRAGLVSVVWLGGLGGLALVWGMAVVGPLGPRVTTWLQLDGSSNDPLQLGRALWWGLLCVIPWGVCVLIGLGKVLDGLLYQHRTARSAFRGATGSGLHLLLPAVTVALTSILAISGIIWLALWQWPLGLIAGLCIEPWIVCLWTTLGASKSGGSSWTAAIPAPAPPTPGPVPRRADLQSPERQPTRPDESGRSSCP